MCIRDRGCGAGATLQVATDGTIAPGICSFMAVENAEKSSIKIYPVPVKNVLNIELPKYSGQELEIEIYSSVGRKVISKTAYNTNNKLLLVNVENLPKGVYFGVIKTSEKSYPLKFIKE